MVANIEILFIFHPAYTAYEALSDPKTRRVYDQYGEDGLKQGGAHHHANPFDIFSQFGFGRRQASNEMPKGPNVEIEVQVTLRDLYEGKKIEVLNRKQILCTKCRGTGAKSPDDVKTCHVCGGTGVRMVTRQLGPGFVSQMQQTCDHCGGKGKTFTHKCPHCGGTKVEEGEERMVVFIEKGMPDGYQIVMEGEGDESPDMQPGDVIFTVRTLKSPRFERVGDDLKKQMKISLLEALVGFSKEIVHLDGHKVKIERSRVTRPNLVIKVEGEGSCTE